MFHLQTLDVYRCTREFLPKAYALAPSAPDGEMSSQLRRAALSISLNIAEGTGRFARDQRKFLVTARGSALECAAVLDTLRLMGNEDPEIAAAETLLVRIVSMLTKMID